MKTARILPTPPAAAVTVPKPCAYEYGKGRVCFMTPSHMVSVLWNPEYEMMQKNAAKWLLRER